MRDRIMLNSDKEGFNVAFLALKEEEVAKIEKGLKAIGVSSSTIRGMAMKQFNNAFKIKAEDVIGVGSTEIGELFARKFIPYEEFGKWFARRYKNPSFITTGFRCYKSDDWRERIKYVDARSSWNSAMSVINKPKFGIILKIDKDVVLEDIKINFNNEF